MSRPEKEGGCIIKHVLLTAKTICVTKILAWLWVSYTRYAIPPDCICEVLCNMNELHYIAIKEEK